MPRLLFLAALLIGCAPAAVPTALAHPRAALAPPHEADRTARPVMRLGRVARLAPPFAAPQSARKLAAVTQAETALVSAP